MMTCHIRGGMPYNCSLYIQYLKLPCIIHHLALQRMCRSIGHAMLLQCASASGHRQHLVHLACGVSTGGAVFDCSFTSTFLLSSHCPSWPHGLMMTAGKTQGLHFKQLIAHTNLFIVIVTYSCCLNMHKGGQSSILCLTSGQWAAVMELMMQL